MHPSSQPDEKGILDRTECSLITQGHRRLYFHTHSNMPVRACEFDVDSEDDRFVEFLFTFSLIFTLFLIFLKIFFSILIIFQ